MSAHSDQLRIAIIGAGPAGLMAAEALAGCGLRVEVFDAMPSVGRKFLMAGKGGMNITHSEAPDTFVARYGARAGWLAPLLAAFGPHALRAWIHGLGVETFIGTSGRVFPTDMKAAPLLRAWLHRLREAGVTFHVRHRWLGWNTSGALRFATPAGEICLQPAATVLALGGASWPQLGSDAAWLPWLADRGIAIAPLQPANCGFDIGWSAHFQERFAGEAVKNVAASCSGPDGRIWQRSGECLISASGIEGGLVYALSAPLRDALLADAHATLWLDLLPGRSAEWVATEVAHPRGARSLSSHLQSRLGLKGVKMGLLHECLSKDAMHDPVRLAAAIKTLPLRLAAPRPIAEAISSAGGIRVEELDTNLMLTKIPGVFCAGEMLDWEAPTGGYLLTACFASGRAAGKGAAAWLESRMQQG
ncbi:TIGR03862 family flavoprotein [Uliginosibacterium sp. 31-16]|uniref:TIGR03862 family flavoprotein n=1 Tax=Uliginosibacterium sp. 31-16 TaxID=3068315 RepID=UPI00273DEDAA|nr:TIGR03862 family flavoprotein [Uliginosibacterium sp. 31-16]MDP5239037.1 TIGR03862 family flavoprotein [Uliginosibacterium sp. 31-16]